MYKFADAAWQQYIIMFIKRHESSAIQACSHVGHFLANHVPRCEVNRLSAVLPSSSASSSCTKEALIAHTSLGLRVHLAFMASDTHICVKR